jgi:peptidoglycan/LPS O-acetylase OafA/YrhL
VLDVLRAAAVVLVLLHHAWPWLNSLPVPRALGVALYRGGWIGVDLFFVLSGYLVAGLLFREHQRHGSLRVGRFYWRRGLKIYPAFYVFLLTTVVVRFVQEGSVPRGTWSEAFFLQSYLGSIWGHTWSLAIEEHFYLALPLLLLVLSRRRVRDEDPFSAIPRLCLAVGIVVLALRLGTATSGPYHPLRHHYATHLRIDSLVFGVLLSYLHHYRREAFEGLCTRYGWAMLVGGVWLVIPAFLFPSKNPFIHTLGFTQLYVGCGMVLSALVVRGLPENPVTRSLAFFGRHSYSIYLWHTVVRWWGVPWLEGALGTPMADGWRLAFYLAGSLALGVGLSQLIEIPVLRVRDRLFPSRSPAASVPLAGRRSTHLGQGLRLPRHVPGAEASRVSSIASPAKERDPIASRAGSP